jgi:hypothetical protein
LTRAGPEHNSVGAGRLLQGYQGDIRIGFGQIGHPLLFNEITYARQQLHDALYDAHE